MLIFGHQSTNRMKREQLICFFSVLFFGFSVLAQEAQFPLVKGHGGVYPIAEATEFPDDGIVYKIIFEVSAGADGPKALNPGLNNLARLVNLHVLGGVKKENLEVVAVVHGEATASLLSDEAYENRFETGNHNAGLVRALQEAGVKIFVCGQSLKARKVEADELLSGLTISLSAVTVLTTYQLQDFALISF